MLEKEMYNASVTETGANPAALLKRGMMAIEDGEWDKANDFFNQVLNAEPECADAYWGQLLAKNQVGEVRALALKYIFDAGEQVPQIEHNVKIDLTQYEELSARIKEYSLDMDITYLLEPVTFYLDEERWMAIKEKVLENIENDKLLKRYIRFSSNVATEKELIEDANEYIDEKIRNAKLTDADKPSQADNALQEKISAATKTIQKAFEEKNEEYDRLYKIFSADEEANLEELYQGFAKLGDFRYAPGICVKIKEKIEKMGAKLEDINEELLELEEERKRIVREFAFSRGGAALEKQLHQIDEEIESKKQQIKKAEENLASTMPGKNRYCPSCGKEIQEDTKFCKYCGESNDAEDNISNNTSYTRKKLTVQEKVLNIAFGVAVIIGLFLVITNYHECDRCDKKYVGAAYYNAFDYDIYCEDCAKDYYRGTDYTRFKVK